MCVWRWACAVVWRPIWLCMICMLCSVRSARRLSCSPINPTSILFRACRKCKPQISHIFSMLAAGRTHSDNARFYICEHMVYDDRVEFVESRKHLQLKCNFWVIVDSNGNNYVCWIHCRVLFVAFLGECARLSVTADSATYAKYTVILFDLDGAGVCMCAYACSSHHRCIVVFVSAPPNVRSPCARLTHTSLCLSVFVCVYVRIYACVVVSRIPFIFLTNQSAQTLLLWAATIKIAAQNQIGNDKSITSCVGIGFRVNVIVVVCVVRWNWIIIFVIFFFTFNTSDFVQL